jgi:hypothetical protein
VVRRDAKVIQEERRSVVVELARELRATRAQLVAEARVQRRRGRRLRDRALEARERNLDLSWRLWSLMALPEPPSIIPLSWDLPRDRAERLEAAFSAAEECAKACGRALREIDGQSRRALASIAGACSLAADRGWESHPDMLAALGLCVRVIESNRDALDRAGGVPAGVLAASAARRCAQDCGRALAASYAKAED